MSVSLVVITIEAAGCADGAIVGLPVIGAEVGLVDAGRPVGVLVGGIVGAKVGALLPALLEGDRVAGAFVGDVLPARDGDAVAGAKLATPCFVGKSVRRVGSNVGEVVGG